MPTWRLCLNSLPGLSCYGALISLESSDCVTEYLPARQADRAC